MKSLKYYINLVEAINQQPDHWIANLTVNYEFPSNAMIPQRVKQIEAKIDQIMKKYEFYESGSGGGFGARDVGYQHEGEDLAQVLSVLKQADTKIKNLISQIENNSTKLGIVGMEMSASAWVNDSDYEYHLSFEEAEEILRQSHQAGKK